MELREKKPKRYAVEERGEAGDMLDQSAIAADSNLMVSLRRQTDPRADQGLRARYQEASPAGALPAILSMPMRAMSRPSSSLWTSLSGPPAVAPQAGPVVPSCAGPKDWPMGR